MMPHEPVPADISASIRYCDSEPVNPLTSVSPVSPAIRALPHGIVMPPIKEDGDIEDAGGQDREGA